MNKITKRALSGVLAVFVAAIGFTSSVAFRCFKSLKKSGKLKEKRVRITSDPFRFCEC